MGDHRASITISMEFHGVKDSVDMWINYNPDGEFAGVDDRVIDFFRDVYQRGMEKYDKIIGKTLAKERERAELAELERLLKKYKSNPSKPC